MMQFHKKMNFCVNFVRSSTLSTCACFHDSSISNQAVVVFTKLCRSCKMTPIRNVVCAVSGGVDSAVAALLLKRKGFNVIGAFMTNWDLTNETGHCTADHDREDARFVCDKLNIPFNEVNFVKEYWNDVFSQFLQGYENGATPNPDVLCNKYIKFGYFFDYAMQQLGGEAVATGHYARNSAGTFLEHISQVEDVQLLRSVDRVKDQTLFLAQISQHALRCTMFPVGDLVKSVVKEMAMTAGLEKIVKKKESTGICFIGTRNFQNFIDEYLPPAPGDFIDVETGNVVGKHKGVHYWTVGQRANIGGLNKAYFIADCQPHTRQVIVAQGTEHPALFAQSMTTDRPHWIHRKPPQLSPQSDYECLFKFQHAHSLSRCCIHEMDTGHLQVTLERPLRALTAGQYAVFYDGEQCLGSACIQRPGPSLYHLALAEEDQLQHTS